jgi:ABC-type transport system involved in multi-copper enzyme maturation permease subunit
MTTVAHRAARPGRAPRFGMGWVTWRQQRATLAGVCGLLAVMIGYMLVTGLQMRSALSGFGLDSCHPLTGARCATLVQLFNNDYDVWRNDGLVVMQVVPMFVGVFAGAPLLARELETGTFRFAWTQGTGRTQWVIVKLVLIAAAVVAAAGVTSLTLSWWVEPFFARGWSLMSPNVFALTGIVFPAWTLIAFALGAFAGVAIRRTVPALAAAMAVWAGLAIATATSLRWRYQPAISATATAPPSRAWAQGYWTGPHGRPADMSALHRLISQLKSVTTSPSALSARLAHLGYTERVSYQPESRFWHFQLIEAGWLLALALLLGAATVWLVRHKAA